MSFRTSARHTVRARADVRVAAGRERPAELVELGMRGARVYMDDPPPEGVVVRLTLHPPTSWEPLVVDALVRWRLTDAGRSVPVGLELSPLPADVALRLGDWLDQLPRASD